MTEAPAPRAAFLFLLTIAAYFAAQVGLRVALGGSFEGDEAEMVVLARDWHFTSGSQPPLYNWYQTVFFDLFGVNTLGLVLAKNLMLFATYATMFLALRKPAGDRPAMVGALALGLIPNLAWWAQRTGSHSIALAAMTALTVAAFLALVRRPVLSRYLLLGLAVGLGGLAKPNYWMVPPALILAALSTATYRAAILDRRIGLSAALALGVVAVPYAAMLAEPLATFADTWEFRSGSGAGQAAAMWPDGLRHVAKATLAELIPALLAVALALGFGGKAMRRIPVPHPEAALLMRAALIGLGLVALGVVATDVGFFRSRWLLPLFVLGLPPLMMTLFQQASARAWRNFLRGMACLALVILAAIADTRLRGAGSDSLRVDLLAEAVEEAVPDVPPLLGPHYFTGNLLLNRPDWTAFPPFPTSRLEHPTGRVLVIEEKRRDGEIIGAMREQGYRGETPPAPVLSLDVLVPYRFDEGEPRLIGLSLYDFGPGSD
ncbi:glycosyltransferase family 39 protein [Rhodovulum sulfidophilum]|uniref:ArnT family glycosyltransferase n=1 Tax=Rhodovulum sulfidophilum TaxID=35806 RepID=UPI001922D38A|nr:glycosyltransferase family 39 protein [Rhodovulum sulfidophilum]MBL3573672.1 glycosyltransferase family 39 protein [Rhodovulum sulfidophilum]MCE8430089.1 glycosyltransferase family 39 protein [Rhodovulum sulfidophilum]MCF4116039.1 glycosyltransferase family 39 protein [Rhodovulum sulfidophilum]